MFVNFDNFREEKIYNYQHFRIPNANEFEYVQYIYVCKIYALVFATTNYSKKCSCSIIK